MPLASSDYCANQAFVLGKHLGMQFHVEITTEMIGAWCRDWAKEKEGETDARVGVPSVQTPEQMQAHMDAKSRQLHSVADRLYQRWTAGLAVE